MSKSVKVRLLHNAPIPHARWCESVGWEPSNEIERSEVTDGAWWDCYSDRQGVQP